MVLTAVKLRRQVEYQMVWTTLLLGLLKNDLREPSTLIVLPIRIFETSDVVI